MAQLTLTFPDGKQVYVYYGLSKWLNVSHQKLDPGPPRQWVPKTNAEIKADTEAALKAYLRERIFHVYRQEHQAEQDAAFESTFNEPDIT